MTVSVLQSLQTIAKLPRRDLKLNVLYSPLLGPVAEKRQLDVVPEVAYDILSDGIKRLRQKHIPELAEVEGSIVRFGRDYDEDDGVVVMITKIDGVPREVKMRLLDDDYNRASDANRRRIRCVVKGTVDRGPSGRGLWLENARNVSLLEEVVPLVED